MPAPAFPDGGGGVGAPRVVPMLGVEGSGRCANSDSSAGARITKGSGGRWRYLPCHPLPKYSERASSRSRAGAGSSLDSNISIRWEVCFWPRSLIRDFLASE